MKSKSSPFPEQTHFVGVLVSPSLERTLEGCRSYMREHYGCRSGQSTPIHVTLIPPFVAARSVNDEYLMALLRYALVPLVEDGLLPFTASVSGFGSFGDRTIYAHVEKDPRWTKLKKAVEEEFQRNRVGGVKIEKKPFVPHLTVANRDIPSTFLNEIFAHFAQLDLVGSFPVSEICLFVKEGRRWIRKEENCIHLK